MGICKRIIDSLADSHFAVPATPVSHSVPLGVFPWLWWVIFLAVHGLLAWVILSRPAGFFALDTGAMDTKTIFATLVVVSSGALWLQNFRLVRLIGGREKTARIWSAQCGVWIASGATFSVLFSLLLGRGGVLTREESLWSKGLFLADWIICELAYKQLAAYKIPDVEQQNL